MLSIVLYGYVQRQDLVLLRLAAGAAAQKYESTWPEGHCTRQKDVAIAIDAFFGMTALGTTSRCD